jgi:hypothetical protein
MGSDSIDLAIPCESALLPPTGRGRRTCREEDVAPPDTLRGRWSAGRRRHRYAPAGQQEVDFGFGEQVNLVDESPRRNVIAFGAHDEHRNPNIGRRDWFAVETERPPTTDMPSTW